MQVDPEGTTEVHVFKGIVRAMLFDNRGELLRAMQVTQGESVASDGQKVSESTARVEHFQPPAVTLVSKEISDFGDDTTIVVGPNDRYVLGDSGGFTIGNSGGTGTLIVESDSELVGTTSLVL